MKRTDWLIDEDGDELLDGDGEYIEGPSNIQEAWECIETVKGELSQFPTAGFGAVKRLRKRSGGKDSTERWKRDLKIELESDLQENPEALVAIALETAELTVNIEE